MKRFFSGWRFRVLVCILVLLAGGMAYAGATGQLTTLPGKFATSVLAPIQRGATAFGNGANSLWRQFMSYSETQAENEALRARVAELEQEVVELDRYRAENEQLKEFYDIQEEHSEWDMIPAFVVGRDPLSQFYSFTVDIGSLKGVEKGDPVVSASGSLVGQVVEAGPGYARVRTILDPSLSAAIMVSRTRDSGLVSGDAEYAALGQCVATGIGRDSAASVGDRVITTGLGQAYPQGLLIGTIADLQQDPSGVGLNAVITPTEDLTSITSVVIITSFT